MQASTATIFRPFARSRIHSILAERRNLKDPAEKLRDNCEDPAQQVVCLTRPTEASGAKCAGRNMLPKSSCIRTRSDPSPRSGNLDHTNLT